jgi:hypothetical protein
MDLRLALRGLHRQVFALPTQAAGKSDAFLCQSESPITHCDVRKITATRNLACRLSFVWSASGASTTMYTRPATRRSIPVAVMGLPPAIQMACKAGGLLTSLRAREASHVISQTGTEMKSDQAPFTGSQSKEVFNSLHYLFSCEHDYIGKPRKRRSVGRAKRGDCAWGMGTLWAFLLQKVEMARR